MGYRLLIGCAALLTACLPFNREWWPARHVPFAGASRGEAVECVSQAGREARLAYGEEWKSFMSARDRFWRGKYRYPNRQRSEPLYFGTWDQITVDALEDGRLRIKGSAWHEYMHWAKGRVREQKPPGPAAHRFAQFVVERCGR